MGTNDKITLSCRLEVLPGNTVGQQFSNARDFGFDAVSLPGRYLPSYREQLESGLPDIALPIAYVSLGFRGSLVSPSAAARAECRDSLVELFDLCARLGAHGLNMPPVLIQDNENRYRGEDFESAKEAARVQDQILLGELPWVAEEAARRGVVLLLEPVNRYESEYMNSVVHAARICREIGHESLGVTCDFFHMQLEELAADAAVESAGKWIKHVHVAENTRVEPGPGSLDFGPGFGALKRIGYDGTIEVECRSLSGPAREVLPRSVRYIRDLWSKS